MSLMFTTVEFEGQVYFFEGKQKLEGLDDFEPLVEALAGVPTNEKLYLWVDYEWLNAEGVDRDMTETEIEYLTENYFQLMEDGYITTEESLRYEIDGVLEEPFEKVYELTPEETQEYYAMKAKIAELEQETLKEAAAQGLSEEDGKNLLRVLYRVIYNDDVEVEEE